MDRSWIETILHQNEVLNEQSLLPRVEVCRSIKATRCIRSSPIAGLILDCSKKLEPTARHFVPVLEQFRLMSIERIPCSFLPRGHDIDTVDASTQNTVNKRTARPSGMSLLRNKTTTAKCRIQLSRQRVFTALSASPLRSSHQWSDMNGCEDAELVRKST